MTENKNFDISKYFKTALATLELPQKYIETVGDVLELEISKLYQIGNSNVETLIEFKKELPIILSNKITKTEPVIEPIEQFAETIECQTIKLDTHLHRLNLSPQYQKLIKRISHSVGVVNTVQDILDIDPIEFSRQPAVGKLYVDLLVTFQNEFISKQMEIEPEITEEIEELQPQITLSTEQLEISINQIALSAQYRRLLKRISTTLANVNTVADILDIDPIAFSKLPAVGKTYIKQLIEFQKQLPIFLENQTQKLALFTENYSIEFSEIDHVLIEDIEGYLWTLDEMKMDIALSRWGFNQQHKSLEDVGKRYNVTRERIRQIEKTINANLPLNFRIQPKVLWVNIREKMTEDLTELLPNLAQCFESEKLFYEFIELCCQVESGSIKEIVFTKISSKIINSFFCYNQSPIPKETIINELMSNYGYSKASAVNGLKHFAKNDRIEITADGICPKNLGKIEAVAHALTFHSAGLPWKDIARIANKKGYSATPFNENRLANDFNKSEYVYQCGHGTYRNLMFLDLEQFNIPKTMQHLLDYFEQRKLNTLHLHDYYQQNKMQRTEIEYFTLRYIVREYGEEYGIFFNGKSGVDSISIDKNAKRITQADVVVSMLNESKIAMTAQEIAERLRSKSTAHARFYLSNLMEEGRVIRVDHLVYTTPEKAFSKIDVDAVMQIIKNGGFKS